MCIQKGTIHKPFLSIWRPTNLSQNASLNSQPFIQVEANLDASSQPKAILFEQTNCPDCDLFHRCVLSLDSVRDRFKPFHTVQLDMWSKAPVITRSGDIKTSHSFARDLKIMYAQLGIVRYRGSGNYPR